MPVEDLVSILIDPLHVLYMVPQSNDIMLINADSIYPQSAKH